MKTQLAAIALATAAAFPVQAQKITVEGDPPTIDKSAQSITWTIRHARNLDEATRQALKRSSPTQEYYVGYETRSCRFGTVTQRGVANDSGVAVLDTHSGNGNYEVRLKAARVLCKEYGLEAKF